MAFSSSRRAGLPIMWTAMIALVRGVILARTWAGSRLNVRSPSASTGTARGPLAADAQVAEHLVPVPDVRHMRSRRQLPLHDAAGLPAGPPSAAARGHA